MRSSSFCWIEAVSFSKMNFFIGVLLIAILGAPAAATRVTFKVQRRFTGVNVNHDSQRFPSNVVDLPLGGNGRLTSTGLYYTEIHIGAPAKTYHLDIDTGSDLTWLNCAGCKSCPKKSNLGIALALYDPDDSIRARPVFCNDTFCRDVRGSNDDCSIMSQCTYGIGYLDGSSSSGRIYTDEVLLHIAIMGLEHKSVSVGLAFGCGVEQSGVISSSARAVDGILGLGPGNSSIVSQLALENNMKKMFAHCLEGSTGGGIFALGEVVEEPKVDTTPLVYDGSSNDVGMVAILVGDQDRYDVVPKGFLKTAIDTGSTLAHFPERVYQELMKRIMARLPPQLTTYTYSDKYTCYKYAGNINETFPIVTFLFLWDLRLKVYPHQYLIRRGKQDWCVGFQMKKYQEAEMVLLGDFVLTDKLVIYNMEDHTIGWTEYDCSSSIKFLDESGNVYDVGAHDISSAGRACGLLWLVLIIRVAV